MPRRAASSATVARSSSEISAPVGLPGELMMMPLRLRRDRRQERVGPEAEAVLGMRMHDHRRRFGELDLLDQRRPAGHVRDHFVARSEQHHGGVVERLLAAGGDDDLARRELDAVILAIARNATAFLSSSVPELVVYFVKFASIAALAASPMWRGVGKSGSPAPKSTTSMPCDFSLMASAATFIVGDVAIRPARAASMSLTPSTFPARASSRAIDPRRPRARGRAPSRRAPPLP